MKNKLEYDKISTYFKLNKGSIILLSISGLIFNSCMALVPIFLGKVINLIEASAELKKIVASVALYFGFVVFVQINRYFKRYYVRVFANKMTVQMRQISFSNLLHEDMKVFSLTSKGDIMNKNLSDIKDTTEGIRKTTTEVFDSVVLLAGYMISMMIINIVVALICLVFVVISISIAELMKHKVYRSTKEYKEAYSLSKSVTLNVLANEIYYRGLGASSMFEDDYRSVLNNLERKSTKMTMFKSGFKPLYISISLMGIFFIVYFLGLKVIDNTLPLGSFTAFLSTYLLVSKKAGSIGNVFNNFQNAKVSWLRCRPYLAEHDLGSGIDESHFIDCQLRVTDMSFGFDESFSIKNISFELEKGEALGICGRVRAGKSTLGAALSGLYDYSGSIQLCGIELKEHMHDDIKNFISYAPSITEVFSDTVKYNVSFDNQYDVTYELEQSRLIEDVLAFPKKEEELLSHSLANISGGQQKRLQIARALYGHPKLIILDDPFNAINIKMSQEIVGNIRNHYQDGILVIINNQKEILRKMDKIIFLHKEGYLLGTYSELLKNCDFSQLMGEE